MQSMQNIKSAKYLLINPNTNGLTTERLQQVLLPQLPTHASLAVVTAPFGARAAHKLPVKKLKRVFSFFLVFLAAYMFHKGINAA